MSLKNHPDMLNRPYGQDSKRVLVSTNYLNHSDSDYNLHYESDSDSETVNVFNQKTNVLASAPFTGNAKSAKSVQISAEHDEGQYTALMESSYAVPEKHRVDESQKQELFRLSEVRSEDSPKMNLMTQFYLGSLTVVGLFMLFRVIQKTR